MIKIVTYTVSKVLLGNDMLGQKLISTNHVTKPDALGDDGKEQRV